MFRTAGNESVRKPTVAGSFYPGDPEALREEVSAGLNGARQPERPALATIVPHAGYIYSGATAAQGLASMAGASCRRLILLGPAHTVGFSGAALPRPAHRAFATPLGEVPIDLEATALLSEFAEFSGPAQAHDGEHCLEVELPFLQIAMDTPRVVPILIGNATSRPELSRIAHRLAALLDDETRVVVSTDFTHHGRAYGFAPFPINSRLEERLMCLGRATAQRAAAVDPRGFFHQVEVSTDSVCGAKPVLVLLELLTHAFDGSGQVLDVTTSAAVSRSWDQVVTYAAIAYFGRWRTWRDHGPAPFLGELSAKEGRSLAALARATLCSLLRHDESIATWFEAHTPSGYLLAEAGVFVSIHRDPCGTGSEERLRGCIGTIEATQPLVDSVVHNATAAARDPRFPPLHESELGQVGVEVSVMSPLQPIENPEELEMGRHGVVLSRGERRALFLPQVAASTGWDRDRFLTQLSLKAGLPGDAWRSGARLEAFTAQVFAEKH